MIYHIMADLETLGTGDNACPWVIAAAKFAKDGLVDKFEVGVDPDNAQRYGRAITGGTVLYWLDSKRDEARKRLLEVPRIDLASAMYGFADWCRLPPDGDPPEPWELGSLWGKGATFDPIILRNAANAVGCEWPFGYKQDECYRTFANRFPQVPYVQHGVAHVGVDDAVSQALHLIEIAKVSGAVL